MLPAVTQAKDAIPKKHIAVQLERVVKFPTAVLERIGETHGATEEASLLPEIWRRDKQYSGDQLVQEITHSPESPEFVLRRVFVPPKEDKPRLAYAPLMVHPFFAALDVDSPTNSQLLQDYVDLMLDSKLSPSKEMGEEHSPLQRF
jgi:hypothetical protein